MDKKVLAAQTLLNQLGFNPGKLDGIYGDDTEAAFARMMASTSSKVTQNMRDDISRNLYGVPSHHAEVSGVKVKIKYTSSAELPVVMQGSFCSPKAGYRDVCRQRYAALRELDVPFVAYASPNGTTMRNQAVVDMVKAGKLRTLASLNGGKLAIEPLLKQFHTFESNKFENWAMSPTGPMGWFQFAQDTAKRFDSRASTTKGYVKVSTDPYASTCMVLAYMNANAAELYNRGGKVQRAIKAADQDMVRRLLYGAHNLGAWGFYCYLTNRSTKKWDWDVQSVAAHKNHREAYDFVQRC